MFTKQLLIGLALGAACTGFAFLMFHSSAELPISSNDNFKLLAQVIPNEPEDAGTLEESDESNVIEVRAVAPAAKKTAPVSEVIETDEPAEEVEEAPVRPVCSYETNDDP